MSQRAQLLTSKTFSVNYYMQVLEKRYLSGKLEFNVFLTKMLLKDDKHFNEVKFIIALISK